jgi:hypothetical protein
LPIHPALYDPVKDSTSTTPNPLSLLSQGTISRLTA